MAYQAGDKVRFKDYSTFGDWRRHEGEVATLIFRDDFRDEYEWHGKWEDGDTFGSLTEDNIILENNHMISATQVMNLELDADTQLLRAQGIEASDGSLTSLGKDVLMRVLYLANRDAVIAKVKEAVAAQKAQTADEDDE